jgi:hypothetical protein
VENDKLFSLYAFTLLAGVASVATSSIMAGFASLPSLGVFVEHMALSLTVRGAYHSFGGPYPLFGFRTSADAAALPAAGTSPSAEEKLAA